MDSATLATFRDDLYTACFTRARDALFDLTDALVSDSQARSLVELSQAACFRRAWPSLYAALADERMDRAALQRLFADHLPSHMIGTRLVLGLDVSSMLRPDAHTSADRTLVHRSNLPTDAMPVGPGWQFSALVVFPDPVSAATSILDTRRIPSTATTQPSITRGTTGAACALHRISCIFNAQILGVDREVHAGVGYKCREP